MDVDMNRTKMIISYLPPLLRLESPELEHFTKHWSTSPSEGLWSLGN